MFIGILDFLISSISQIWVSPYHIAVLAVQRSENVGRGRKKEDGGKRGGFKMEQVDKASIHGHSEGMKNILHQETHGHQ